MAGRLNTKFLVIVAAALVVLAAGVLGLWALSVHRSIDDRIALGDQYMRDGFYQRAANEYGKVIHKTKDKRKLVPALIKFYDATRMVPVAYGPAAYDAFRNLRLAIENAIREAPDNVDIFQRHMDIYMELGVQFGDFSAWDEMYDRANKTLQDTDLLEARKYRGLAQVNRLLNNLNLGDEEREAARADLSAYLERFPEDIPATFHLAVAYMIEADLQMRRPGAAKEKIEDLRNQGATFTQLAMERHPDDVRRALDHARVLLRGERRDEAQAIVARIESVMIKEPGSRQDVLILLDLIGAAEVADEKTILSDAQRMAHQNRRHALLAAAVQAHPDDLVLKVHYGRSLSLIGKASEAMEVFEDVRKVDVLAPAVEAFVQTGAQQMAAVSWTDLRLTAIEKLTDADARRQQLDEIEQTMATMRNAIGESNSFYHLLRGRLYLLQGRWVDAAQSLRQANDQFHGKNPAVLDRLAVALEQTNQGGAAIELLQELLKHRGLEDYMPAKYRLVRLNIKHRQYAQAEALLNQLKAQRPDDRMLDQLRLDMLRARGQIDQAIALVDSVPIEEARRDLIKAQLYMTEGRREQAHQILSALVKANPTDETALSLLMDATDDKEELLAAIARAREAGVKADWLGLQERRLSGQAQPQEIVEEQLANIEDPFQQHVARYQVLSEQGKWQEAEAEFAQARQMKPEDAWVLNEAFARALAQSRWDDAAEAASRAGALDIDRARGMFYQGRLAMARQTYDRAVSNFREALDRRPDFDVGWRLLGDAQQAARDLDGALESYRKAIELVPDNLEALQGLAAVHSIRQEHPLALEQLRKAYDYAPKNRPIRNAFLGYLQEYGDKQEALGLRRQLAKEESDDDDNIRSLALLLAELKQPEEARATLDALIEKTGIDLTNAVARAELVAKTGTMDEADDVLEQFVTGLGDAATMNDWLVLARFRLAHKIREPGLSAYRKAITFEDPQQRPASREMAERLFELGEMEQAAALYRQLLEQAPQDRQLGQRCVEVLVLGGKIDEADQMLRRLIEQRGEDDASYLLKATIAGARGNTRDALEALEQAEKLNPQRPLIYLQRARIYARQNRLGEARKELTKALRMAPNDERARLLLTQLLGQTGEYEAAIAELQALLKQNDRNGDARLQLARLYMATDRLVQAREVLDRSMEMFPDEWRWPYELAQLDRRESRPTKAAERLQRAFELEHNPDLLNELAIAHIQAKRPEKALEVLRDNHDLVEQYPLLNSARGWALGEVDKPDEATEAFNRAIASAKTLNHMFIVVSHMKWGIGPTKAVEGLERAVTDDNRVLITIVLAQLDLDDHNFDSTVKRLDAIEAKVPIDSPVRRELDLLLSIALHQTGDFERAKDAYLRLIKLDPTDVQSLNNLAYLLSDNLGQPEAALPHVNKANELVPNNAQILDTLGWIQFKAGHAEDALRNLRSSVEIRRMPANSLHLAEVLLQQRTEGAVEEALLCLKRAKRLAERYQDKSVLERTTKLLAELEPAQ